MDADGMPPPAARRQPGFAPWTGQGAIPWYMAAPWSRQGSASWHGQGEGSWHSQGGNPWHGQGLTAWDAGRADQAGLWAQPGGLDSGSGVGEREQSCGDAWDDRSMCRWSSHEGMPPPLADRNPGSWRLQASPRELAAPMRASAANGCSPAPRHGPNPSRRSSCGRWACSHALTRSQSYLGARRSRSQPAPALSEEAGAEAAAAMHTDAAQSVPPNHVLSALEGQWAPGPASASARAAQGPGCSPAARGAAGAARPVAAVQTLAGAGCWPPTDGPCLSGNDDVSAFYDRSIEAQREIMAQHLSWQPAACAAQHEPGLQQFWQTVAGEGEEAWVPRRRASSVWSPSSSPSSSADSARSAAGADSPGAGLHLGARASGVGGRRRRTGIVAEVDSAAGAHAQHRPVAMLDAQSPPSASSGHSGDAVAGHAGNPNAARAAAEGRLSAPGATGLEPPAGASCSRSAPDAAEAWAAVLEMPPAWRAPPATEPAPGIGGPETAWEAWYQSALRDTASGQAQEYTDVRFLPGTTPRPAQASSQAWYGPGVQAAAPAQPRAAWEDAWHESMGRAPAGGQPQTCSQAWHDPRDTLPGPPHDPQDDMMGIDHASASSPRGWDAPCGSSPSASCARGDAELASARAGAGGLPHRGPPAARRSGPGAGSARDGAGRGGVQADPGSLRGRGSARRGRSPNWQGARAHAADLQTDALERASLVNALRPSVGLGLDHGVGSLGSTKPIGQRRIAYTWSAKGPSLKLPGVGSAFSPSHVADFA